MPQVRWADLGTANRVSNATTPITSGEKTLGTSGQNEDVAVLHNEVGDVLRAEQDAVREHREQRDDRDQGDEDAVLAQVREDMAEPVRELVLRRIDGRSDGGAGIGIV